jgi:hypothetical protein
MTDRDKDYLESFLAHQRAALCRVLNDEVHKIHLRLVLEGADIEALIEEQRQICVRRLTRTCNGRKTRCMGRGTAMTAERDRKTELLESGAEPPRDVIYASQPFAAEAMRHSSATSKTFFSVRHASERMSSEPSSSLNSHGAIAWLNSERFPVFRHRPISPRRTGTRSNATTRRTGGVDIEEASGAATLISVSRAPPGATPKRGHLGTGADTPCRDASALVPPLRR